MSADLIVYHVINIFGDIRSMVGDALKIARDSEEGDPDAQLVWVCINPVFCQTVHTTE